MWLKFIALFKFAKICTILSKLEVGLLSLSTLISFVKSEVAGSKLGEQVGPYLDKAVAALDSFKNAIDKVAIIICPAAIVTLPQGKSVKDSLADLDRITKELNDIK